MTDFTYNGADHNDVQYGGGRGARWKHFSMWLSPSAPASAPVLISLPGGGWLPSPFQLYSREDPDYDIFQGGTEIPQAAIDNGMHVVRAMYPNAGGALDLQVQPATCFPHNVLAICELVQFLKDNASTYGLDTTKFCLDGSSAGGHLALLSQVIPLDIGLAPYRTPFPLVSDRRLVSRSSPRVRAVINRGGPLDFEVIDPTTAGAAAKALFYSGDRYDDFKGVPSEILRAASPYWWAQRNSAELANLAVFTNYTGAPTADPDLLVWGEELADFTGIDDSGFGKPWQTWHEANASLDNAHWETLWGAASGNFPNTGGNIGQSGSTLAATLVSWWSEVGLIS